MKIATFALASASLVNGFKYKTLDLDNQDFGEFMSTFVACDPTKENCERHLGLPDDSPFIGKYLKPTQKERDYHGACFQGDPHHQKVPNGQYSKNSQWRCGLINHKRDKGKPREFVCFPLCTDWGNGNPDKFKSCRLHAPFHNPINGQAYCKNGKWVVRNKLKECFCDGCDPKDAQRQLRQQQRRGRLENYGADFTRAHEDVEHKKSFLSWTHQQIIVGTCGPTCKYQPVGYQQGNEAHPIKASSDPPTAVCDRKKRVWNFKDKCNCMDLCTSNSPGLPKRLDEPGFWPRWEFISPRDHMNAAITYGHYPEGHYLRVELKCGTQEQIDKKCGPKGLKKRDKRHYFCANGGWISGADHPPHCECEKNKKVKKSKDKHNKDKPKKNKPKGPPVDGNVWSGTDRPNKPSKKEQTKHKKNKH